MPCALQIFTGPVVGGEHGGLRPGAEPVLAFETGDKTVLLKIQLRVLLQQHKSTFAPTNWLSPVLIYDNFCALYVRRVNRQMGRTLAWFAFVEFGFGVLGMSGKGSWRTAKWALSTLVALLIVQFGVRPAYNYWQSLQDEAREERCTPGAVGDPRKKVRPDGQIKTIRLTDQGTYVDRCELVDARYELDWDRNEATNEDPAAPRKPGAESLPKLAVMYVHGWQNDARQNDGDYVEFKKLIDRLQKENDGTNGGAKRQVTGIYLSWSARSDFPVLRFLTFWDRMHAADRISQSAVVTATIGSITSALDQSANSDNQLILIGHSFGARILQAATSQSFLYALQQARPHRFDASYGIIRGVADAVILLNPAFEATMYRNIDDVRHDGGSFSPEQTPLLITIATTNDSATKYAYPVGQWLAQRASPPEMTTLGNYRPYATHSLHRASSETDCDKKLVGAPVTQGFFAGGLCLDRLPTGKIATDPFDPFLVVTTTPDIIDNHTGIWTATFSDWLFRFISEFTHSRHVARRPGKLSAPANRPFVEWAR